MTREIRDVSRVGSGALRNRDNYLLAGHMEKRVEWQPERKKRWLAAVREASIVANRKNCYFFDIL